MIEIEGNTEQEKREFIVKTVWDRLNDGTGRAYDEYYDICSYCDPKSGNKCAVGIFLPDEAKKCRGSVSDLYERFAHKKWVKDILYSRIDFWQTLQGIHDEEGHWDGNVFVAKDYFNAQMKALEVEFRA